MTLHYCEKNFPYHSYGRAIDECKEEDDGKLYCNNGEYDSQVNFCPFCGYEAKVKAQEKSYV